MHKESLEWCPRCNKLVPTDTALTSDATDTYAQIELYCLYCHLLIRLAYSVKVGDK